MAKVSNIAASILAKSKGRVVGTKGPNEKSQAARDVAKDVFRALQESNEELFVDSISALTELASVGDPGDGEVLM